MCGRLYTKPSAALAKELHSLGVADANFPTLNNVYPSIEIPVVAASQHTKSVRMMHWRFQPDLEQTYVVRIESLMSKPFYAESADKRRAIVFVDGFIMWRRLGKTSQPFLITPCDGVFALGAVWKTHAGKECVGIISQRADEQLLSIDDRMPLMLSPEHYTDWFNPKLYHVSLMKELQGTSVKVKKLLMSPEQVHPANHEPIQ